MNHTIIGLDVAKHIFHLVEINHMGKRVRRKTLRRPQMLAFFANLDQRTIAMEACSSAHYWARELMALGHRVQLLPAQHVKPYLRGQKNDYNDAQAIAEAAHHGVIRPVAVKTVEQHDVQALHRIRRQLVKEKTAMANQLRGLLSEYGICIRQGVGHIRRAIPLILEDADNGLTSSFRAMLDRQYQRLIALDEDIAWYQQQLEETAKRSAVCQRLMEVPGMGVINSSALLCWMGDGQQFNKGRDASAALGVVPRQHSSGGKPVLLGITKRGDAEVRTLVIHGARSVVIRAKGKTDALSQWVNRLVEKRGINKATVALANKLIRIAWVIVARGERYRPTQAIAA